VVAVGWRTVCIESLEVWNVNANGLLKRWECEQIEGRRIEGRGIEEGGLKAGSQGRCFKDRIGLKRARSGSQVRVGRVGRVGRIGRIGRRGRIGRVGKHREGDTERETNQRSVPLIGS
jgi:hypothetical protein